MQKNQLERVAWIDIAKGILILLVVLGHLIVDNNNPVNRFVLAFHMPAFFFYQVFSKCRALYGEKVFCPKM